VAAAPSRLTGPPFRRPRRGHQCGSIDEDPHLKLANLNCLFHRLEHEEPRYSVACRPHTPVTPCAQRRALPFANAGSARGGWVGELRSPQYATTS
jgi:hypothetical protein